MFELKGCFTALPTPFRNDRVDEDSLRKIIRFQIENGVSGLLPCGSTGEAATLGAEEYERVIKIAVEEAKGKLPVMAGTGTNSTSRSVAMAKKTAALGVDALLVIVPYYNKPTQDGQFAHFSEVSGAVDIPVIVYNIPGRTGVNMLPSTLIRLRKKCRNIVGVKEASGNMDQVGEILNSTDGEFSLMSGDDSLTLPMMSLGARGVVSVISNVAPAETAKMCALFAAGKLKEAAEMHHKLLPLMKALFVETNPAPVKSALAMMGLCGETPRLPLVPVSEKIKEILKSAMLKAEIKFP
ncbi:MAG: 4-hydroxy-tetrahydrodipicolinate synthase [bacterium]